MAENIEEDRDDFDEHFDEEVPEADLRRRYRLQVCFLEPDEPELWETVFSEDSPMGCLHGASVCCERVKNLLDSPWNEDLPTGFVRFRIVDAEAGRVLLWEEEGGALAFEDDADFSSGGAGQSSSF
jgi:hypothetical protein